MKKIAVLFALALALVLALHAGADVCVDDCPASPVSPVSPVYIYLPAVMR